MIRTGRLINRKAELEFEGEEGEMGLKVAMLSSKIGLFPGLEKEEMVGVTARILFQVSSEIRLIVLEKKK
jgi:hypothetical protein